MKSLHPGWYAGLAILLAGCGQTADPRPSPSPVSAREVRSAAAELPVSRTDVAAAEAALVRAASG
jgi:hypothetical protein